MVLVCRCGGTRAVYTSASFSGQSDFASQKSCICVTLVSQNPPVLLPQKSVCQPLSARTADGEASPFPASAGSKGITHYTLQSKIVCQGGRCPLWIPLPRATLFPFGYPMPTGMLSPLLDDPEPKGGRCPPLETSRIFCVREYPNCKITVGIPRLENKKGQKLIPRIG